MDALIRSERERLAADEDLTPPPRDASPERWKAYQRVVTEIERDSLLDPNLPVETAKRLLMDRRRAKARERMELIKDVQKDMHETRRAERENHPRFAERKAAESVRPARPESKPSTPPPSPLDPGPPVRGLDEAEKAPRK